MDNFNLARRIWLKQAVALSLAALTYRVHAITTTDDILLGGGRFKESADGPVKFVLSKVFTGDKRIVTAETTFLPHGLAFSPLRPGQAFVFEKIGPGACVVDVAKMQTLDAIPGVAGRQFYGHGVCSADGKLVYSTETSPDGQGAIGIRDVATLAYVGDFPTYGLNPHECYLIEGGKVLLVTNGGGTQASGSKAALCYIDVQSQRLLERVEMPDERFNTGHVFPFGKRQAVVVSAPRKGLDTSSLGAISVRRQNAKMLEVLSAPEAVVNKMFGETLSVSVIPEKDLFIATHPTPGMVTFWQTSTLKLRKVVELNNVRGVVVTSDRKAAWLSYDQQTKLVKVDLASLELDTADELVTTYISGSHLINLGAA